MSFLSTLFQIIQEFKALLIALVILCIIKFIRKQKGKQIDENDDEVIDYKNLSPEEQKVFLMTELNTRVNRDMPKEQEKYLQSAYEYIYGKKAKEIYERNVSKIVKNEKKKRRNVRFSEEIEYSRN